MIVNSHNTAISRVKSSKIAQLILKSFDLSKYSSILDFGCGHGKDCQAYTDAGMSVEGYDKFYKPAFPDIKSNFDIVALTYVLNVIPDKLERLLVLELAFFYVKPGGYLVVTTRTDHDIGRQAQKNNWDSFEDGYCSSMNRKTFQKGFKYDELKELLISSLPIADIELMVNESATLCFMVKKRG